MKKQAPVSYTLELFQDGEVIEIDVEGNPDLNKISKENPMGNYRMTRSSGYEKETDTSRLWQRQTKRIKRSCLLQLFPKLDQKC